ncbi:EAL domain-containing protein [Paraburkholderia sp. CNPSo 3281]|uniref:EAL domain-containing protein n=1 Tax=unclassified Paraburkholderia TaxID=2615204 RepID=UPI0035CCFA15
MVCPGFHENPIPVLFLGVWRDVAKHYGLQVIAEGVETESQHVALRAAGVPFAQGYLYQRPVTAEQLALTRPLLEPADGRLG